MEATIMEISGDASETDVKLVFPDKAAIPGFDPLNSTPVQALKVVTGVPGLDFLILGHTSGTLQFPDQEVLGDLDPQNGELVIGKTELGELATPGTALSYQEIVHQGQSLTLVTLSAPAVEPPPEPEPEPEPEPIP